MGGDSLRSVFSVCFTENVRFEQQLESQLEEILDEEVSGRSNRKCKSSEMGTDFKGKRKKKKAALLENSEQGEKWYQVMGSER